jgi:serine protease Do
LSAVEKLVDQARAAVVNVEVVDRSAAAPPALSPWDRTTPDEASIRPGTGSGFVIDPSGIVLTNHHLIENARLIYVTLVDGRRIEAHFAGADPATDVALLRFVPSDNASGEAPPQFPSLKLTDSDHLKVGDWLVALGNPSGPSVTASVGIVSAKSRSLQRGPATGDFLQTDAAIHPGNSGGPLLNLRGEVVGLSTALMGGGTGIGFAVASHTLLQLLPQLEKNGHVARGWLGAYVKDLTPELALKLGVPVKRGAVVTSRLADSPASRGGLDQDDVITRADARPVESASVLVHTLLQKSPGSILSLTVFRAKKRIDLRLRIGELPEWLPVESSDDGEAALDPFDVLGFTLASSADPKSGPRIDFVRPGSPAALAGLCEGAVIREAAGVVVHTAKEVEDRLRRARRGSAFLMRIDVPQLAYPRLRAVRVP